MRLLVGNLEENQKLKGHKLLQVKNSSWQLSFPESLFVTAFKAKIRNEKDTHEMTWRRWLVWYFFWPLPQWISLMTVSLFILLIEWKSPESRLVDVKILYTMNVESVFFVSRSFVVHSRKSLFFMHFFFTNTYCTGVQKACARNQPISTPSKLIFDV